MATKAEVSRLILVLNGLYPHQAIGKGLAEKAQAKKVVEAAAIWHQVLGDIPYDALSLIVRQIAGSGREFYPPPGVIRQSVFEMTSPDTERLTPGEGWAEVKRALGNGRSHKWTCDLVRQSFEAIGGWQYMGYALTSSEMSDRARFFQAFEQFQSRERTERRMLPAVREYRALIGQTAKVLAIPPDSRGGGG